MDDLISRQAALDAIRNLYPDMPKIKFMDNVSNWHKKNEKYIECEKVISALPSAQPKKGKWYDWSFTAFDGCTVWHRVCSVCGYKRDDDNLDKDTNFCPNCGAQMEGGENETD